VRELAYGEITPDFAWTIITILGPPLLLFFAYATYLYFTRPK
jgi:hypothetical protein